MRRIFAISLLLFFLSSLSIAQTDSRISCPDETNYRTQFTIIPPQITDFLTDVTVTALGQGNFEPIIAITASDGFTECYSYSPEAEFYDLSLPSGNIPPNFTNASGIVFDLGQNQIQIAEVNGNSGAIVVLLEAFILEEDHTFQFDLSDDMLSLEGDHQAYLVSLSEEYQPALTITDAEGTESIAEPDEVDLYSIYGDALSAVSAPLPDVAGRVELTVNANESGFYALIIELQSGDIQVGDGAATVETAEDASLGLQCDGTPIFENGLRVVFPDDDAYTATVLASSIDPMLAILDENDTGTCYDDSPDSLAYTVDLPSITIERDTAYPQTIVSPDDTSLVFGGHESEAGNYVLFVEGGDVSADDDGDLFEISLTPQILTAADVMIAYVFTTDLALDPILTWEPDEGDAVVCNDAGIPDSCDQDLEEFSESLVTFGDGETILGSNYNPMLEIPIDPGTDEASIRLRVTAAEESSGEYILVLHLVTD